jgi:hypothetical protein
MKGPALSFFLLVAAATFNGGIRAEDVTVTLRERAVYEVQGGFRVPASREEAWAVIADYDHIGEFVGAVKKNRSSRLGTAEALVEQELSGKVLFFSRRVRLALLVQEAPPAELRFRDRDKEDFETYEGYWRLEESDGGTKVSYHLDARPRFGAPGFMARNAFRKNVRDLLNNVREEILRRHENAGQNDMEKKENIQ